MKHFTAIVGGVVITMFVVFIAVKGSNHSPWKPHYVHKKYCVDQCLKHYINTLHNEGSSWGTGSSSLKGFADTNVLDKFMFLCSDFYREDKCCKVVHHDNDRHHIQFNHGYDYGACKE